jgi:hypothetical protein
MRRSEIDRELERLRETADQARSALLEVEVDSTRELLDQSTLTGETGRRWTAAREALAAAWERHAELAALLEQAADAGNRGEAEALLARAPAELGAASAVGQAREVMAAADAAWGTLRPRLDAAAHALQELPAGQAPPAARRELTRLVGALTHDPLAVAAESVEAVEASLAEAIRAGAEQQALRRELAERLGIVREALDELDAADAGAPGLRRQFDQVLELSEAGRSRDALAALVALQDAAAARLDAAQEAERAARAAVEALDELRGVLGAYRVKARRLRVLEDGDVAAALGDVEQALDATPADLAGAQAALRHLQQTLSSKAVPR